MPVRAEHRPDVVVTDARMPPTHTDEGTRAAMDIRRRRPEAGMPVLSQYMEKRYATELITGDAGRVGCLRTYLLTPEPSGTLAAHRESCWITGCERCRGHLLDPCARDGFTPNITYGTDDMVVTQALVAAGPGVTTIPGPALRAHRAAGIEAMEVPA